MNYGEVTHRVTAQTSCPYVFPRLRTPFAAASLRVGGSWRHIKGALNLTQRVRIAEAVEGDDVPAGPSKRPLLLTQKVWKVTCHKPDVRPRHQSSTGAPRHHLKRTGADERLSWRDSDSSVHRTQALSDRTIEPPSATASSTQNLCIKDV